MIEKKIEVAVYYFPQWHEDPQNVKQKGAGWTEWEQVKTAEARFPGHTQPKVPVWGYEDEADPAVMSKKIQAAADHGIDTFIFDWYWNDAGPYLNGALDDGFLKADNVDQLQFALMWCNHDLFMGSGEVKPETFEAATQHAIEHYFGHPSYWRIEGKPYFSIYQLFTFIETYGSVAKAADAVRDLRARVKAAGLGELHLNAVAWGIQIPDTMKDQAKDLEELTKLLGVDSVTSYVWIHHTHFAAFPAEDYRDFMTRALAQEVELSQAFDGLPYHPNASMGWDPSPRTRQGVPYENKGYPWTTVLTENTPEAFRDALLQLKAGFDKGCFRERVLTVNAWNEWGEGSYLEPDTVHGDGYLQAIQEVFGK